MVRVQPVLEHAQALAWPARVTQRSTVDSLPHRLSTAPLLLPVRRPTSNEEMSAILSRPQAVVAAPPPAVAPAARAASQRRHPATFLQRRRLHPAADVTTPGPARRLLPPTRAAAVEELAPAGSVDIESLEYVDGCFSVQGCLITAASPDTVYQVGDQCVLAVLLHFKLEIPFA